jgi:hypothetical protein
VLDATPAVHAALVADGGGRGRRRQRFALPLRSSRQLCTQGSLALVPSPDRGNLGRRGAALLLSLGGRAGCQEGARVGVVPGVSVVLISLSSDATAAGLVGPLSIATCSGMPLIERCRRARLASRSPPGYVEPPLAREAAQRADHLTLPATAPKDACVGIHAEPCPMTAWRPTRRSRQPQKPCKYELSDLQDGRTGRQGLSHKPTTKALRGVRIMELGGLEPPTSWVRSRRSPN